MNEAEDQLPCTDKLAFDTEKEALTAATVAKWSHGTALKVYRCRHCGLYHLATA